MGGGVRAGQVPRQVVQSEDTECIIDDLKHQQDIEDEIKVREFNLDTRTLNSFDGLIVCNTSRNSEMCM